MSTVLLPMKRVVELLPPAAVVDLDGGGDGRALLWFRPTEPPPPPVGLSFPAPPDVTAEGEPPTLLGAGPDGLPEPVAALDAAVPVLDPVVAPDAAAPASRADGVAQATRPAPATTTVTTTAKALRRAERRR